MRKTSFFYKISVCLLLLWPATPAIFAADNYDIAGIKIERKSQISPVLPNDPGYFKQWYLEKIGAPEAWRIKLTDARVTVAVIDTGVYIDNPDLRDNIWVNNEEIPDNKIDDDKNGYVDDVNGWDFVNNVADPNPKFQTGYIDDEINHGTLVAGIIAAKTDNGFAVSGIAGQAKIMPLKVLDDRGEGTIGDVVKAIDYAVKNGAKIINLSFATTGDWYELRSAIERAGKAGVVVVAPAGNENKQTPSHSLDDKKLYPVCYGDEENNVIGVVSTDALDQKMPFSNYGFSCADIAAPGASFMSLTVVNPYQLYQGRLFDKYYDGFWDGTSMSTAVVSGSLALLKAINPKLDRAELINFLLNSTDDISALNPKYAGQMGRGRINLARAANAVYADLMARRNFVAVAPQVGINNNIKIFNNDNLPSVSFKPFSGNLGGGVSLSVGDVNGDGREEIIASAGTQVKIFDQTGKLKNQFSIYQKNWKGYFNLASGDVNGDGRAEIIIGLSKGNDSKIRVFDEHGILLSQFFAYALTFRGGVNVAAADVNFDGLDEIITGAGAGGGPQVRVFDRAGRLQSQFFAYAPTFRGGVNVTAGDFDGDGAQEIITGAGAGGSPHIRVFTYAGKLKEQFFAYDTKFRGGVNVAAADVNFDGLDEIITGAGA
ncbi:MAG: S8 family serine peptidase, partial [Patescibacteria group bacterium]